jgi:hypothetical protein
MTWQSSAPGTRPLPSMPPTGATYRRRGVPTRVRPPPSPGSIIRESAPLIRGNVRRRGDDGALTGRPRPPPALPTASFRLPVVGNWMVAARTAELFRVREDRRHRHASNDGCGSSHIRCRSRRFAYSLVRVPSRRLSTFRGPHADQPRRASPQRSIHTTYDPCRHAPPGVPGGSGVSEHRSGLGVSPERRQRLGSSSRAAITRLLPGHRIDSGVEPSHRRRTRRLTSGSSQKRYSSTKLADVGTRSALAIPHCRLRPAPGLQIRRNPGSELYPTPERQPQRRQGLREHSDVAARSQSASA